MLFTTFSVLAAAAVVAGADTVVIPRPSSPYSVKTEVLDLTDESRWDPYANANATHKRRILASAFLPLESCDEEITTPYLPPATNAVYVQLLVSYGLPADLLDGFEVAHCASGKAAEPEGGFPLILLSPGFTGTRLGYSVKASALASLGYVVVTIDHPYDSFVVEFPDGSISYGPVMGDGREEILEAVDVRTEDISFLLDQLAELDLPIDHSKIISAGHSLGGWASGAVAFKDDRVLAGLNEDGRMEGPVVESGLSKPFIQVGTADTIAKGGQEGWRELYDNSKGTKLVIGIDNTTHNSWLDPLYMFTFTEIPADQLPALHAVLGSLDGKLMLDISLEYLTGLADLVFYDDATTLKNIENKFEAVTIAEEHYQGSC